jgi:4a-hydroxytetrahydrobiopterin dehydratase
MNWIESEGALTRTIQTPDFLTAFRMASALVEPAEAMNHHPDIAFGWGYLRIRLTTHDAGGITQQDQQLAVCLDAALKPFDI